MTGRTDLVTQLAEAREAFLRQLDRVEERSLATPGLVGDWSGRELVAHLGYWAGHATEAIHAVESGRVDELDPEGTDVDAVNETVARVARETDVATVRRREAASVEALVDRLRQLDDSLLGVVLPDGDTLLQAVTADGPDHYREHADALRAALDGDAHG